MKGMDIFCASPGSTAICSSVDHRSVVRRSHSSRRSIDHHHHHNNNPKPYAPLLSINPNPSSHHDHHQKSRKTSSSSKQNTDHLRRKSSADITDLNGSGNSSRYLLSDKPFIDWLSDSDHQYVSAALVPCTTTPNPPPSSRFYSNHSKGTSNNVTSSTALIKSSSTNTTKSRDHHQVVVLWVSIHCKGCEGKVRKHISKMEGVTSFSIDLATKKVTVIGNVTPLGVLASLSKVKSAQLWPSSTSTSSSSSSIIRYRS